MAASASSTQIILIRADGTLLERDLMTAQNGGYLRVSRSGRRSAK